MQAVGAISELEKRFGAQPLLASLAYALETEVGRMAENKARPHSTLRCACALQPRWAARSLSSLRIRVTVLKRVRTDVSS
jgi:hypothetical protein